LLMQAVASGVRAEVCNRQSMVAIHGAESVFRANA
jgi:hypothetical protein